MAVRDSETNNYTKYGVGFQLVFKAHQREHIEICAL
jgi:hypothetical protein